MTRHLETVLGCTPGYRLRLAAVLITECPSPYGGASQNTQALNPNRVAGFNGAGERAADADGVASPLPAAPNPNPKVNPLHPSKVKPLG